MISQLAHLVRYGSFDHDLLHGRDKDGRLVQRCVSCGFSRVVLGEDVNRNGPAHQPLEVPGKPQTKTYGGTVEQFHRKRA